MVDEVVQDTTVDGLGTNRELAQPAIRFSHGVTAIYVEMALPYRVFHVI